MHEKIKHRILYLYMTVLTMFGRSKQGDLFVYLQDQYIIKRRPSAGVHEGVLTGYCPYFKFEFENWFEGYMYISFLSYVELWSTHCM